MAQEIEIEVKTMVTEDAYLTLLKAFHFDPNEAIVQNNHYFETNDFFLKSVNAALRIRERNERFTLTLKQPHQTGLLETHQILTKAESTVALQQGSLPNGEVLDQLNQLKIPVKQLTHLGTLTTSRIEFEYKDGLLCLDKSTYFDVTDYEVEFEGTSEEHAETTLNALLKEFGLSKQPTENKVRRFFARKFR
jgi:uncharacterized protein YjbK